MKKLFPVLFLLIALACADHEPLTPTQSQGASSSNKSTGSDTQALTTSDLVGSNSHEVIFKLTKQQQEKLGTRMYKYTPTDKEYASKTHDIREAARAARLVRIQQASVVSGKNEPAKDDDPIGDGGNYYEVYDASGAYTSSLETGTNLFYSSIYGSNNLLKESYRFSWYATNDPVGMGFGYVIKHPTKNIILGTSLPDSPDLRWLACFKFAFMNYCGSPEKELICGLIGLDAPEIPLMLSAYWAVACLFE